MELDTYIKQYHGGNVSEFARLAGMKRTTLTKILSGAMPGVDKALDIERASGGKVGLYDLARRFRFGVKSVESSAADLEVE